jgi:hypothetical protein
MGWVERITPWFAVVVIMLAAVWLGFAAYTCLDTIARASRPSGALWGDAAIYTASLVGAVCIGLVGVRVAAPSRAWPGDGAVRLLATLGLLLAGIAAPLIVLRAQYGLGGVVVALTPLIVYYVRIRRALVEILPQWAGGTWKPAKRRPRADEDVIKRPPRTWDATSGTGSGPASGGAPAGRQRRKQGKKKRRPGR